MMMVNSPSAFILIYFLATSQAFLQNASWPDVSERAAPRPGRTQGIRLPPKPRMIDERTYLDDDRFSLGSYEAKNERTLFESTHVIEKTLGHSHLLIYTGGAAFEEPAEAAFYLQVLSYFANEPEYNIRLDASSLNEELFSQDFEQVRELLPDSMLPLPQTGQPVSFERVFSAADGAATQSGVSVFDPRSGNSVCGAWVSLVEYCDSASASTSCLCYSGSAYVPDMYNSLAATCAEGYSDEACAAEDYWCSVKQEANQYRYGCETYDIPSTRFAQNLQVVIPTSTDLAVSPSAVPTEAQRPSSSPEPTSGLGSETESTESASAMATLTNANSITAMSYSTTASTSMRSTTSSASSSDQRGLQRGLAAFALPLLCIILNMSI